MNAPNIMKAQVASGCKILKLDAIEFDKKLWLVPEWYVNVEKRVTSPVRIIRFDNLGHQKLEGHPNFQFSLVKPIPESVLDGKTTDGYEVHEVPDIVGKYHLSH